MGFDIWSGKRRSPSVPPPPLCCVSGSSEAVFFKQPNDARMVVLGGYVLVPAPSRATTLVKKNVNLIRRFIQANRAGGITGMALSAAAGAAVGIEDVAQAKRKRRNSLTVTSEDAIAWNQSDSRPPTAVDTAPAPLNEAADAAKLGRRDSGDMKMFIRQQAAASQVVHEKEQQLADDAQRAAVEAAAATPVEQQTEELAPVPAVPEVDDGSDDGVDGAGSAEASLAGGDSDTASVDSLVEERRVKQAEAEAAAKLAEQNRSLVGEQAVMVRTTCFVVGACCACGHRHNCMVWVRSPGHRCVPQESRVHRQGYRRRGDCRG